MIGSVFPVRTAGTFRRFGVGTIILAVVTFGFFPVSSYAGTETAAMRIATAVLLLATGASLIVYSRRVVVAGAALALMVVFGLVTGATWLVYLGLLACGAAATSLFPRVVGMHAASAAPGDIPAAEVMRENVEAIAMALVLALTVREFAFEAFVIPTGSMEPTIHGNGADHKGDRLLAAKAALYTGDPPRWSIQVFHFPLFRPTNFIKRLVGLPGEHLEIRDGDVYADGVCQAKPDVVQETLWSMEFPDRGGRGQAAAAVEDFFEPDGNGEWTLGPTTRGEAAAGETSWLSMTRFTGSRKHDFRISFDVRPGDLEADGAVFARVGGAGRRVTLEVSATGTWLTAPGTERTHVHDLTLASGEEFRIGLAVADRVVRVSVNGRRKARITHPDETNGGKSASRVSIGIRGGQSEFSDIRVDSDLHYSETHEWDIPEDCFVVLGDNTHSSRDSRKWDADVITDGDGNEYVADTYIKLDDGPRRRNLRETDGKWVFLDSNGVRRAVDTSTGSKRRERLPFVHREDLVGRAFFIFFPIPPFFTDEWRPRFLP